MNVLVILFAETKSIAYSMQKNGHNVQYLAVSKEYFDFSGVKEVRDRVHYDDVLGTTAAVKSAAAALGNAPDLIVQLSPSHQAQPMAVTARDMFPNVPFVGPYSKAFSNLETERGYFKDLCSSIGVNTPSPQMLYMKDLKSAIKSGKINDLISYPVMVKPYSYVDGIDSDERFLVAKVSSNHELSTVLDTFSDVAKDCDNPRVLLEPFVEGTEIACGAFFNGESFVGPWMHMYEYKKFASGNIGPNIDEPGVACYRISDPDNDKIVQHVKKFSSFLSKHSYVGYFDVNFIQSKDTLWALEPDCRFPFPASIAIALQSDIAVVLKELAEGKQSLSWNPPNITLCAAVFHIGYPLYGNQQQRFKNHIVSGLHKSRKAINSNLTDFDEERGDFLSNSYSGYMFAMIGEGEFIDDASIDLRKTFDSIKYPFMYYRSDIGK